MVLQIIWMKSTAFLQFQVAEAWTHGSKLRMEADEEADR
jgi:hypothetical protein